MKKFLAANQQQRQLQMEKEQETESSNFDVSCETQTTGDGKNEKEMKSAQSSSSTMSSLPLHSHLELLSGVPVVGSMMKRQKSISSQSNGPDSPPDAMDLINMAHPTSSDLTIGKPSVGNDEIPGPGAMPTMSIENDTIRDMNRDPIQSYSDIPNNSYTMAQDNKVDVHSVANFPTQVPSPKVIPGQQRNVVLERRTDLEDDSTSKFIHENSITCATNSVPMPSCDDVSEQPKVPIIPNVNKQSVHSLSITSETTASTTSSISSSNTLSVGGQTISCAKNPYLMKKQHSSLLDNQRNDFQNHHRDLDRSDNISSASKLKIANPENPSIVSPLDSPKMISKQSESSVREMAKIGPANPVTTNSSVPIEKSSSSPHKIVTEAPLLKSSEKSPGSGVTKSQAAKPKEELTKEEREQQRRNKINAFSEWQKKQKEALAKKDEERKLEQEKRRQEEIASIEQRKRLKSVRIPKRNKEFSPLVSPNPSSPNSVINPTETLISDPLMDRTQNQDSRMLFTVASNHRTTQQSLTLAHQQQHQQQLQMPQPQHQVVFNMSPQQPITCMSSQELPMDPALSIYCNSPTKPVQVSTNVAGTTMSPIVVSSRQQQSVMPISAPQQQQQIPGTGPVNIDLGPVVQSTIVKGVKSLVKSFTQHWVNVEDLKVLMLDFGGAFTLFVPNMEGNFFHVCTTEVEVQVKPTSDGTNLTYMKFVFQSPPLEIVAPVLEDRNLGYRVLKQNTACVFLGQVFPCSGKQQSASEPQMVPLQHVDPVQNLQIPTVQNSSQHLSLSQQTAMLIAPDAPLTQNPQQQQQQQQLILSNQQIATLTAQEQQNNPSSKLYYSPQSNAFHEVNSPTIAGMSGSPQQQAQQLPQIASNNEPISLQQSVQQPALSSQQQQQQTSYSHLYHQQQQNSQPFSNPSLSMPGVPAHGTTSTESSSVLNINIRTHNPSHIQQNSIQSQQQQLIQFQHPSNVQDNPSQSHMMQGQSHTTTLDTQQQVLNQETPQELVNQGLKQQRKELSVQEQRIHVNKEGNNLLFPEEMKDTIYPSLKPKELEKVIKCNRCSKKFAFLSEHLVHLEMHTNDVESTVEMSINIWVPERRLKCDLCKKFKTSYTLQYARHRDKHIVDGLACKKCMIEVNTPFEYAEHLKIHHPKQIFSEPQEKQFEPIPVVNTVVTETSSYNVEKTSHSIQDNEDHIEDTDVIEANIGKEIGDEEMLESIFGNDGNEQKGILDDSHEHDDESNRKDKEMEHSSMPILNAGEENAKAARTKSVDSFGNEEDLLKAIEKCEDQQYIHAVGQEHLEESCTAEEEQQDLVSKQSKPNVPIMEDDESVDNSVLSLVKGLTGRIAEQSFGFDEDEVGPTTEDCSQQMYTNSCSKETKSKSNQTYKPVDTTKTDECMYKGTKNSANFVNNDRSDLESSSQETHSLSKKPSFDDPTDPKSHEVKHAAQPSSPSGKESEISRVSDAKSTFTAKINKAQGTSERASNTPNKVSDSSKSMDRENEHSSYKTSKISSQKSSDHNSLEKRFENQSQKEIDEMSNCDVLHTTKGDSKSKKSLDARDTSRKSSFAIHEKLKEDKTISNKSFDNACNEPKSVATEQFKSRRRSQSLSGEFSPTKQDASSEIEWNQFNSKDDSIKNQNPSSYEPSFSDEYNDETLATKPSTIKNFAKNTNSEDKNVQASEDEEVNKKGLKKCIVEAEIGITSAEEDLGLQLQLSDDDEEAQELDKEMAIDNTNTNFASSPENDLMRTEPDDHSEEMEESPLEHSCTMCGDKFVTTTSLKIHKLKCGKDSSSGNLSSISKQSLQNVGRQSPCISISSSSTSDDEDTASEDTSLKCEHCNDQFRSLNSFKMHQILCKKKKKEGIMVPIKMKDANDESAKRQYVIPEDLSDQVSNRVVNSIPAYTSDDEDDNADGIWKRKSMLARERRKSWLKNKTQRQSQNIETDKPKTDSYVIANRQRNPQHVLLKNKHISSIKASPSSSSVPCSSAPSEESSYSSSDEESLSITNKTNQQSSFEQAVDSDKNDSGGEESDDNNIVNFGNNHSILSAHFNKKSVKKNIEKLKQKTVQNVQPVTSPLHTELINSSRLSPPSLNQLEEPKGLKLRIKVGGDFCKESNTTVLYVPPKRGRGRPRGSKNGRGGRVLTNNFPMKNMTPNSVRKVKNIKLKKPTETTGLKISLPKSILFPSISNQEPIPLPHCLESERNTYVPNEPVVALEKKLQLNTPLRVPVSFTPIQKIQSTNEDKRTVPKLKIKVPNFPSKRSPQNIRPSYAEGLVENNDFSFEKDAKNSNRKLSTVSIEDPLCEPLASNSGDLSEISDSLTEISDTDDVNTNVILDHIASTTQGLSKSPEPNICNTSENIIEATFKESKEKRDVRKQVSISGCNPTEWRKNRTTNCESTEENKLLTQLECLSCSVSLGYMNAKDEVESSKETRDKEHSEDIHKLSLCQKDIHTLKENNNKFGYRKQNTYITKYSKPKLSTNTLEDLSDRTQKLGFCNKSEGYTSKKSVPPLKIRLSSISSIDKNRTRLPCPKSKRNKRGEKLSTVLSSFVHRHSLPQQPLSTLGSISVEPKEIGKETENAFKNEKVGTSGGYIISGSIHKALDLLVTMGSADEIVSSLLTDILSDAVARCDDYTPRWMNTRNETDNNDTSVNIEKEIDLEIQGDDSQQQCLEVVENTFQESHNRIVTDYDAFKNNNDKNEVQSIVTPLSVEDGRISSDEYEFGSENTSRVQDEFQVIRIPRTTKKPVNRRKNSGLSGSDYKKRKRSKPKKLDKLIIKNISKLLPSKLSSPSPFLMSNKRDHFVTNESEQECIATMEKESTKICCAILNELVGNLSVWKVENEPKVPPLIIRPIKLKKDFAASCTLKSSETSSSEDDHFRRNSQTIEKGKYRLRAELTSNSSTGKPGSINLFPPLKLNMKTLLNRKNSLRLGAKRSLSEIQELTTDATPGVGKMSRTEKIIEPSTSADTNQEANDKEAENDKLKSLRQQDILTELLRATEKIKTAKQFKDHYDTVKANLQPDVNLKSYSSQTSRPSSREASQSPTPNNERKSHSLLNFTSRKPKLATRKEMWILGSSSLSSANKSKSFKPNRSVDLAEPPKNKKHLEYKDDQSHREISPPKPANATKVSLPGEKQFEIEEAVPEMTKESLEEGPNTSSIMMRRCTCKRKKDIEGVLLDIDEVLDSYNESDLANELSPTEDENSIDHIEQVTDISTSGSAGKDTGFSDVDKPLKMQRQYPTPVRYYKEDQIDFIQDGQSFGALNKSSEYDASFPLIKYPGQLTRLQHRQYLILKKKKSLSASKIETNKIDDLFANRDYNAKVCRWQIRREMSMRRKFGRESKEGLSDSFITASNVLNDILSNVVSDCEQQTESGISKAIYNKKKRSSISVFSRNGYVKRRRKCYALSKTNSKVGISDDTSEKELGVVVSPDDALDDESVSKKVVVPILNSLISDVISNEQMKEENDDMWSVIVATAKAPLIDHNDDSGSLVLSSEIDDMDEKNDYSESNDASLFIPKINNNSTTLIIRSGQGETRLVNDNHPAESPSVLPYKCLPYQFDYGSSLGDDESMSSDAMCNNDTSQDEEEYTNHKETLKAHIKSKLSYGSSRQKTNSRSPFSSSGYVRRRRRRRTNKKVPISNLVKDSSICTKDEDTLKLSLPTLDNISKDKLVPEISNISNAQGDVLLENEDSESISTSTTFDKQLETDQKDFPPEISDSQELLESCKTTSSCVIKKNDNLPHMNDDPLSDQTSGTAKTIRQSVHPQFVQRNFYVKDEFAAEVPACLDESEKTPVIELGRGKRKRIQNVRMLPIDEAVVSKVKSPSGPVPNMAQSHINESAARAENKDDLSNDVSPTSESDLVIKSVMSPKQSEESVKGETIFVPDFSTKNESKLVKMKQNRNKSAINVSKIKRVAEAPSRVHKKRTTKKKNNNIDKKCNLSIEEELRIIKHTMENSSTNDESTEIGSTDDEKKEDKRSLYEDDDAPSKLTTVLPPRKRKTISTLANDQELITETRSTCENEEIVVSSSLIKKTVSLSSSIPTIVAVNNIKNVVKSHGDLLTRRKTTSNKNNDVKSLLYRKVISQKAKDVIERSSILKERKLSRLVVAATSENIETDEKYCLHSNTTTPVLSSICKNESENNSITRPPKTFDKSKSLEKPLTMGPKSITEATATKSGHISEKNNLKRNNFAKMRGKRNCFNTPTIQNKAGQFGKEKEQKEVILVDDEVSFNHMHVNKK